ncbi:MAG: hypothetical protein ACREJG_05375 [Candidatus Rokuibacteriota bacterium]
MKSLWGVGAIIAGLVVLAGIAGGVSSWTALQLGPESKAYVDRTVPEIVKAWNAQDLVDRASPDLVRAVGRAELDRIFATSSKELGRLKAYGGSWQEKSDVSLLDIAPRASYVYLTEVVFENGGATIGIGVAKRYGLGALVGLPTDWKVTEFTVQPKDLVGADVETPAMRAARQAPKDGARGREGSSRRPARR